MDASNSKNSNDDGSSFDLGTVYEQAKTVHKRQRESKKSKKRRIEEDEFHASQRKSSRERRLENRLEKFDWSELEDDINESSDYNNYLDNYDESEDYESIEEEIRKEERKTEPTPNPIFPIQKKRPNHFVAIRVSDPAIHLAIQGFQDAVLKENEKLKPALIPLISLHITLAVMHLDETTIKLAQDALEKCKEKISEALKDVEFKLVFSGVGNFDNKIVFAKLQKKAQIVCLKTINRVITGTFEKHGICLTDKREYNPHLTLLKLSRMKSSSEKKVEESVYASWLHSYFGEELVNNVHLCSMDHKVHEEDGFYKCLSTVTFCNDSDSSK